MWSHAETKNYSINPWGITLWAKKTEPLVSEEKADLYNSRIIGGHEENRIMSQQKQLMVINYRATTACPWGSTNCSSSSYPMGNYVTGNKLVAHGEVPSGQHYWRRWSLEEQKRYESRKGEPNTSIYMQEAKR